MATAIEGSVGYVPTLPEALAYIDKLLDSGTWCERGITHWHLVRSEAPLTVGGRSNESRFDSQRIAAAVATTENVTKDPREVLRWIYTQHVNGLHAGSDAAAYARMAGWGTERDFSFGISVSWEYLTEKVNVRHLVPIGRGVLVRDNLSLDVHAYPQTASTCKKHT